MKSNRWYVETIKMYEGLLSIAKHSEVVAEKLASLKREYRYWLLHQRMKPMYRNYENSEIVNSGGDYDTRWMKIFFNGERWNSKEKEEFIEDNWKHCTPSQYDCTDQIFTSHIGIFDVPNGTVVYIFDSIDC